MSRFRGLLSNSIIIGPEEGDHLHASFGIDARYLLSIVLLWAKVLHEVMALLCRLLNSCLYTPDRLPSLKINRFLFAALGASAQSPYPKFNMRAFVAFSVSLPSCLSVPQHQLDCVVSVFNPPVPFGGSVFWFMVLLCFCHSFIPVFLGAENGKVQTAEYNVTDVDGSVVMSRKMWRENSPVLRDDTHSLIVRSLNFFRFVPFPLVTSCSRSVVLRLSIIRWSHRSIALLFPLFLLSFLLRWSCLLCVVSVSCALCSVFTQQ